MSVYLIAQLQIHDRERYAEYEAGFMEVFQRFEGKLLAVDESPETIEGDWSWTRTVLIEFPSDAQARRWYQSDAYQALAQHRWAASDGNIVMIRGLDPLT
ncbi:MAG: DUF1330 domain-containing protein [Gammaproteobacteria bacterium]|nr:DUF1330 domain-containing protein [Gammaproteobacteria bacterium]